MTTIRATTQNNSDAQRLNGTRCPGGKIRHNGGKTLIIETDDVTATHAWLDSDRRIVSYQTPAS